MPPDALQPKAYCRNPGLQSFLLAPPGVSTRDLVVKGGTTWVRNGRWILSENARLPRNIQGLLHAINLQHGTNGFISLPKEGVLRIFSP